MSSLTIDELKKALTENGVVLPAGRTRKEDYVKLYEEVVLNDSLGNTYSSDDENSQNSRRVTSTNGDNSQGVMEAVANLSNEDLFLKLKELGFNAGPVLQNTRRVYEKKLYQLLQGDQTNGHNDNSFSLDPNEISDNEVEITTRRRNVNRLAQEKAPTPQPEPSSTKREKSREPSIHEPVREVSIPRRISYIEKIPRGTSERIIEPIRPYSRPLGVDPPLRSQGGFSADSYVGRWSPSTSTSRLLSPTKTEDTSSKKNYFKLIALLLIVLALALFIYTQWSATDPYKLIEDDVEKEVKEFVNRKN